MGGTAPFKILVIEDNATIREVLKMGLEIEGYSVLEAADGAEALSALERPPYPGLILLDLLMPRMNGYEFLECLKKDPSHPIAAIPVIVLSAVAKIAREKLPSVEGVFSKPVDLDKLFEAVRRYCP